MIQILVENYITYYNGVEVKWFIGDINSLRAKKLQCATPIKIKKYKEVTKTNWFFKKKTVLVEDGFSIGSSIGGPGSYWEAWGSCNGHAYQLAAWFDKETRELVDITVLPAKHKYEKADGTVEEKNSFYFHEETYKMLTQKK